VEVADDQPDCVPAAGGASRYDSTALATIHSNLGLALFSRLCHGLLRCHEAGSYPFCAAESMLSSAFQDMIVLHVVPARQLV
jgi:hypothetical protein